MTEREAWEAVAAAYARLVQIDHRHSAVVAARIEVEQAIADLKRLLGKPPTYTTYELQALRAGKRVHMVWP